MNPDGNQYSWYENGEAKGIAAARCVGKLQRIAVIDDGVTVKEILNNEWPNAENCVGERYGRNVCRDWSNENVDGALLMTYTAQKLARDDTQKPPPRGSCARCIDVPADGRTLRG